MGDREFLERIELVLREMAERRPHATFASRGEKGVLVFHHVSDPRQCERCRLMALADEAADRAPWVAA